VDRDRMRQSARLIAKQLKEASRDAIWMESPPQWVIQVVSQITYFTAGDTPAYITHNLTQINGVSERVFTFTAQRVLITTVKKDVDGTSKITTEVKRIQDISAFKMLGVSSIFSDVYDEWPHAVYVELALPGADSFKLPQAEQPTDANYKELESLVRSLVNKL
jgi:hypothetical protein